MRLTYIWEGVEALQSRMTRLVELGRGTQMDQAFMPGAELMAERWRGKVPVATGKYHDSIQVVQDEDGVAVLTDAINEMTGTNYPELLEMGTSYMAAQPSAQPAFDESVDEAIDMAIELLDDMILEVVAR